MKNIKIKCPAKINLTLEILNKREDGFHNINSIMQTINLYDYLNIIVKESENNEISLTGNNPNIPYDESNLVYKAASLFLKKNNILNSNIKIDIQKNIPVSAGLAGGSTDGAGTLFGLNEIFNRPMTLNELHKLCSELGSDLNVCLEGGCLHATSRGESITILPFKKYPVTLIKPKNLGISAKEAYTKYALKSYKPKFNNTEKMIDALNSNSDIAKYLYNDLEYAIFEDYKELQYIKSQLPNSVMSGSGSTYFILGNITSDFPENYEVIKELEFIPSGCTIA